MSETLNIIRQLLERVQLDQNFSEKWNIAKVMTQISQNDLECYLTTYTLQTAEKATIEEFQTRDDSYTPFLNIVLWEGKPEILEFLPNKLKLVEGEEIDREDLVTFTMPWEERLGHTRRFGTFKGSWCKCKTCLRLNRTCAICVAKINKLKNEYDNEYGRMKKGIDRW